MNKNFIFFTRNTLPQPYAHLVQITNSANAAANLGYPTVMVYVQTGFSALNPIKWLAPFQPQKPKQSLINFYNLHSKLKVVTLPMFWPRDSLRGKLSYSHLVCNYYWPRYILSNAQIVYTRHWNFAKTAIKYGVPAIYEHHHYEDKQFKAEIVNNPLLLVVVTVADTVRESLVQSGMPREKILKLHSGFNQSFLLRYPEKAQEWREKLLLNERQSLVVYSGALYRFKGIDLLIEVARDLPKIQFVFVGGSQSQVQSYQQLAREKGVRNVTFLGYILHEQLPSLLQAADVLAHPHCSGEAATFTSPLKFFEYMASGTPIVATKIPPLIEFKSSGAIAGWCEPDNPREFAQCLQQVLEKYPRKVEGYTNNFDFVGQFSWENRITNIMSRVEKKFHPINLK